MMEWKVNLEFNEQGPDSPFWADDFSERLLHGLAGYHPVFMRPTDEPGTVIVLLSVEAEDQTQAAELAEYLVTQLFDGLHIDRMYAYQSSASTLEELLGMALARLDFDAIADSLRNEGFDAEFPSS